MEPDIMQEAFQRAMRGEGGKVPPMSKEEEERYAKAFKDPEFCKLFAEYADEISDPKNRAEQEQYIAQLEGEKKLPEGKELMRPEPGFVVKAFKRSQKAGAGTKEKMFINICQSDKLLKPVSTRSAEKGTSWTFPHALGPVRMEQDKSGSNAPTFDCCFHPDTLRMAQTNAQFRQLTVQVAIDSIIHAFDKMQQKVTVDEGFKVLKGLDYKGAVVATMMMDKSKKEDAFKKGQAPPKANAPPQPASSAARPSTSTPTPAAKPTPSPTSKLGPQPPKYSITERGHVDLGDYMMADPLGPKSTRPKELLIKIELPLVKSAGELELDVDERRLVLSAGMSYLLDIRLPYPVIDERSAAKFDKAKRVLNVTIPVQPPPQLPPRSATAQGIEDITVEGQEGESADQEAVRETGSAGRKGGHDRWVAGEEEERLVLDQEEIARAVEKAKAEQAERAAREAERAEAEGPSTGEPAPVEEAQVKEVDWSWFNEAKEFNARRGFVGARPGYVFKTGPHGLGYYRDEIASASASTTKVGNGVVKSGQRPEFRFQQVEGSLTLIVSVPTIDLQSVRADWGGASRKQVDISFEAVEGRGSAAEVRKGYYLHLDLVKEIEGTRCRFDVAAKNMLVVLYKAKPELWLSLEEEGERRQPEAPSGKENKGEAVKTGVLPSIGKQLGQGAKGTAQFRNKVALELD